jgi:hypothetical protein
MKHKLDTITKAPDLTGEKSRAWRIDIDTARAIGNWTTEEDATIAAWLVEAPWAHPAWHSYVIVLMHLRPLVADKRETKFYLEGATHEMWLYAIDPKSSREDFVTKCNFKELSILTPINFAAQIIEPSDDAAIARVEKAVQEICNGELSPDTDFQSMWEERFGNHMIKQPDKQKDEISMSLYNIIKGTNPNTGLCLRIIGITLENKDKVPRFRDAWFSDDGTKITLLTRAGGSNRKDYEKEIEWLRSLPNFVEDHDDTFDRTYAHFVYSVPEEMREDTLIVTTLLILTGSSEDRNGPQGMLSTIVDPQRTLIPPDHPMFWKGYQAYRRLSEKIGIKFERSAEDEFKEAMAEAKAIMDQD